MKFSLRDRARISDSKVAPQLFCVTQNQLRWFRHLTRSPHGCLPLDAFQVGLCLTRRRLHGADPELAGGITDLFWAGDAQEEPGSIARGMGGLEYPDYPAAAITPPLDGWIDG